MKTRMVNRVKDAQKRKAGFDYWKLIGFRDGKAARRLCVPRFLSLSFQKAYSQGYEMGTAAPPAHETPGTAEFDAARADAATVAQAVKLSKMGR